MTFARCAGVIFVALAAGVTLSAQVGLPVLSQPIPDQTVNRGPVKIDLRNHFGVPGITGQVVQFTTVLGRVNVEMRSTEAPRNVANFLSYVGKGAYDNTFVHRVDRLGTAVPAIVHGGAYPVATIPPLPAVIVRNPPVPLEYQLPNTRGTLAMFHPLGEPNGATSEWFFNVLDNTTALGPGNDGGTTVIGRVLGTGMSVVDAISQMQLVSVGGTALTLLPVRDLTTGQSQLTPANLAAVNTVRVVPIYPPKDGDPSAVVSFSLAQSTQGAGTVALTLEGSELTISPLAEGSVSIQIRAVDSNGNASLPTTFTVSVPPQSVLPPVFTAQPSSHTVGTGTTVVISAFATGGSSGSFPIQYHWRWKGEAIPAPNSPYLVLPKVTPADAGAYTCLAVNAIGQTLSAEAVLTVVPAEPFETGRLVNLAIRTFAGMFDETLIVGFGVGGAGTSGGKPLLVRGIGPTLGQFGILGALPDPVLTLYQGGRLVSTNDNWGGDAQVAARALQVGAFSLGSGQSLDAAMAVSTNAGAYTIRIEGRELGHTGTALAEIYDATPVQSFNDTTPRLVNASARAQINPNEPLIAGFVIGGSRPTTVLVRGIGPGLAAFGIEGVLANPRLRLFEGNRLVRENDDWAGDVHLASVSSTVGAFAIANPASQDAMVLATLPPGTYTAQVIGDTDAAGVALIEVYEVR